MGVFLFWAVLKVIVDLLTMLIGAEGARLLREDGAGETPQALKRRGGSPNRPRKAKLLERKSTGKFNTALFLRRKCNEFQSSTNRKKMAKEMGRRKDI
jgi:hypothetical protein